MAVYDYNIQMYVNEKYHQTIAAKQFDAASRFLKIQLLQDNGQPYDLTGHRVQFNAKKLSGQHIMNDAVITDGAKGLFSVELTDQTLAEGDTTVTADITVFGDNNREVLTTRTFQIRVEKTVRNDNAVESSNEYNSVVILFRDVWDMRDVIKSVNDKLGDPADGLAAGEEKAGESGFGAWNRIYNYLKTQNAAGAVEIAGEIKGLIGDSNPTVAGTNTVMNYLKAVNDRVDMGVIKSVQRGIVAGDGTGGQVVISIAQINPLKSVVIIDNTSANVGRVLSLTATILTVEVVTNAGHNRMSWQVIEFY